MEEARKELEMIETAAEELIDWLVRYPFVNSKTNKAKTIMHYFKAEQ